MTDASRATAAGNTNAYLQNLNNNKSASKPGAAMLGGSELKISSKARPPERARKQVPTMASQKHRRKFKVNRDWTPPATPRKLPSSNVPTVNRGAPPPTNGGVKRDTAVDPLRVLASPKKLEQFENALPATSNTNQGAHAPIKVQANPHAEGLNDDLHATHGAMMEKRAMGSQFSQENPRVGGETPNNPGLDVQNTNTNQDARDTAADRREQAAPVQNGGRGFRASNLLNFVTAPFRMVGNFFAGLVSKMTSASQPAIDPPKWATNNDGEEIQGLQMGPTTPGLEGTAKGDLKRLEYQNAKILEFAKNAEGDVFLREGIFRVNGTGDDVNYLRENEWVDFTPMMEGGVQDQPMFTLATLFKKNAQTIAEHPDTKGELDAFKDQLREFIEVPEGTPEKMEMRENLIAAMPEYLKQAVEMAQYLLPGEETTKMDLPNMGTVFALPFWGNATGNNGGGVLAQFAEDSKLTQHLISLPLE